CRGDCASRLHWLYRYRRTIKKAADHHADAESEQDANRGPSSARRDRRRPKERVCPNHRMLRQLPSGCSGSLLVAERRFSGDMVQPSTRENRIGPMDYQTFTFLPCARSLSAYSESQRWKLGWLR